jgi:hypothetical protein
VSAERKTRTLAVGQVWASPILGKSYRVDGVNVTRGKQANRNGVEMQDIATGERHVMDAEIVAAWWTYKGRAAK